MTVMFTAQYIVNDALKIMYSLQPENSVVTLIKLCSLSIQKYGSIPIGTEELVGRVLNYLHRPTPACAGER